MPNAVEMFVRWLGWEDMGLRRTIYHLQSVWGSGVMTDVMTFCLTDWPPVFGWEFVLWLGVTVIWGEHGGKELFGLTERDSVIGGEFYWIDPRASPCFRSVDEGLMRFWVGCGGGRGRLCFGWVWYLDFVMWYGGLDLDFLGEWELGADHLSVFSPLLALMFNLQAGTWFSWDVMMGALIAICMALCRGSKQLDVHGQ